MTKNLTIFFDGVKNIVVEKEKMLVTSIFSFSHNVFQSLLSQSPQKLRLCGKELSHGHIFSQFKKPYYCTDHDVNVNLSYSQKYQAA